MSVCLAWSSSCVFDHVCRSHACVWFMTSNKRLVTIFKRVYTVATILWKIVEYIVQLVHRFFQKNLRPNAASASRGRSCRAELFGTRPKVDPRRRAGTPPGRGALFLERVRFLKFQIIPSQLPDFINQETAQILQLLFLDAWGSTKDALIVMHEQRLGIFLLLALCCFCLSNCISLIFLSGTRFSMKLLSRVQMFYSSISFPAKSKK